MDAVKITFVPKKSLEGSSFEAFLHPYLLIKSSSTSNEPSFCGTPVASIVCPTLMSANLPREASGGETKEVCVNFRFDGPSPFDLIVTVSAAASTLSTTPCTCAQVVGSINSTLSVSRYGTLLFSL